MMRTVVVVVSVGALLGGIGGMAIPAHQSRTQPVPAHKTKTIRNSQSRPPASGQALAAALARKVKFKDQLFRDFLLTGSETASAEWAGANGGTCGITPHDRYIVIENSIGKTRLDEPTDKLWLSLGCEETAPRNQNAILARQAAQQQEIETNAEHSVSELAAKAQAQLNAQHAWEECRHQFLVNWSPPGDGSDAAAAYEEGVKNACPPPPD